MILPSTNMTPLNIMSDIGPRLEGLTPFWTADNSGTTSMMNYANFTSGTYSSLTSNYSTGSFSYVCLAKNTGAIGSDGQF